MSATAAPQASAPAQPTLLATVRARLSESSTWAGIGGILLVALNLLPAALPGFHAALGRHGWARITGLLVALLSFVIAVARKEGNTTVAQLAQAAEVLVESECTQRRADAARGTVVGIAASEIR